MKPSPELIKLVDQCLANSLSRTEMARLEELLEHHDNLHYYIEMAGIEASLPVAFDQAPAVRIKKPNHWLKPLAIAAAVVFVFTLGHQIGHSNKPDPIVIEQAPAPIAHSATITSLIGVTWETSAPNSFQLNSQSQPVTIESGLIELTFSSGVRTLIEGPAKISVTGDNHAYLTSGRLVADVPKGAEGFTVDYASGRVVDIGTEFAMHVPQNAQPVEIGVFRGAVEVYQKNTETPVKLIKNHAITHGGIRNQELASVPFRREEYIRYLPSREFPWQLPRTTTSTPTTQEFDVSHLVWKSGDYLAIIKWMHGRDATRIHGAELLLNGTVVATDQHTGVTGDTPMAKDNTFTFSVPEDRYQRGTWTLRVKLSAIDRPNSTLGNFTPESSGVLLFEDFHALKADEQDFVGTWEYRHHDTIHRRTFHPNRTASYSVNGNTTADFAQTRWSVENGVLSLTFPDSRSDLKIKQERHRLHKKQEIIFLNKPYRNGYAVKE
ncbi:FecR domain-containing protein [Rubritalea tangerina]|uniref:FecR domain-containing protein n=1 Tax=Rubritalea tangerina TaxID=430798 RepID=A0ABW4ZDN1_9BACT